MLAVAAFAVALAAHRRPVVNLLAQAALLAVAIGLVDDFTINQVGASWALLEVTMRARRPRTIWLGAGAAGRGRPDRLDRRPGRPGRRRASSGWPLAVGVPVLLGLVIRTTRELGRQAEERAVAEQRQHESESRAARADERSAIARELHDVVAHHVASMVLRVGVARHVLTDLDPRVGEVFDDVHGTGTAALAELRRLVAVLRDPDGVRGDAALTAIEPSRAAGGARRGRRPGPAGRRHRGGRHRPGGRRARRGTRPGGAAADPGGADQRGQARGHVRARARCVVAVAGRRRALGGRRRRRRRRCRPGVPPGGGHGITGMRERVEVLGGRLEAGPTGTGWRVRPCFRPCRRVRRTGRSVPREREAPAGSPAPEPA